MRTSVVVTELSVPVREAPRVAREMGFAGVEFDLESNGIDLTQLSGSGQREFRHLLSTQGQALAAVRVDVGAKGLMPDADVDKGIAMIEKGMKATRALGAEVLCVELGMLPKMARPKAEKKPIPPGLAGLILIPETKVEPVQSDEVKGDEVGVAHVKTVLGQIGELADRVGVVIAFKSGLSGFASLNLVRQVNCPWFGIDLDPVAILEDSWSPDEVFDTFAASIRHVVGRDAIKGTDHRTRPVVIGAGSTDWDGFKARLDASGFNGWVGVDVKGLLDKRGAIAGAMAVINEPRAK